MKKIFEIILLFIVIFSTISLFALSIRFNGFRAFGVVSGSMEPFIPTGSLVITKAIKPKLLQIGDIITFIAPTRDHEFVTHRITKVINSNGFLTFKTKGDKNKIQDEWILTQGGIVGQVVFFIPLIGYIFSFISSPIGIVLLILLPSLYVLTEEIKNVAYILQNIRKKETPVTTTCVIILLSLLFICSHFNIDNSYALLSSSVVMSENSYLLDNQDQTIMPSLFPTLSPSPTPPLSLSPSPSPILSVSPTSSLSPLPSSSVTASISPDPVPLLPAFGTCPVVTGHIQADYSTGMHAIVGMDKNQPGSDEVFDIGNNNYTQCYCPITGTVGIQTNWLAAGTLRSTDIYTLMSAGWTMISKGADWGLSSEPYLAKNEPSVCLGNE